MRSLLHSLGQMQPISELVHTPQDVVLHTYQTGIDNNSRCCSRVAAHLGAGRHIGQRGAALEQQVFIIVLLTCLLLIHDAAHLGAGGHVR